jgi:hypothetical protein
MRASFVNFLAGESFRHRTGSPVHDGRGHAIKLTTSDDNQQRLCQQPVAPALTSASRSWRSTASPAGSLSKPGPRSTFNVSNSSWDNQSVKNISQTTRNWPPASAFRLSEPEWAWGSVSGTISGSPPSIRSSNANWSDVNLRNSGFQPRSVLDHLQQQEGEPATKGAGACRNLKSGKTF